MPIVIPRAAQQINGREGAGSDFGINVVRVCMVVLPLTYFGRAIADPSPARKLNDLFLPFVIKRRGYLVWKRRVAFLSWWRLLTRGLRTQRHGRVALKLVDLPVFIE